MKGNIEPILKMKLALSGGHKSSHKNGCASAHQLSFQLGHLDTYHTFFTFFIMSCIKNVTFMLLGQE